MKLYNNYSKDNVLISHFRLETAKLMASALGGLSDAEAGAVGLSSLAPQYVEFKDLCRRDMQEIKERMAALRSLHGRASLSKFDDTRDDEAAVEVATQQVTKLFRRCEARLQEFSQGTAPTSADEKVQRNVQRTLAVELQKLSVQFRKQQKQYLQRLRARDGQTSPAAGALDVLDSSRGDEDVSFIDPGFSNQQALKAESLTSLIDERDKEVVGIVKSIHELAQIMKDISVLVIDQGTVLDRIDYNLEQTAAGVEQGVTQLRRAERTQRKGTAAACVMILLIAVGAMALIVILKALLA